jgi:hypothetical protein
MRLSLLAEQTISLFLAQATAFIEASCPLKIN